MSTIQSYFTPPYFTPHICAQFIQDCCACTDFESQQEITSFEPEETSYIDPSLITDPTINIEECDLDQLEGYCSIRFSDGVILQGEFFKGVLLEGKGKLIFSKDNEYEGDIVNGMACGTGTWKVSGYEYTGHFENGTMLDGIGSILHPDQSQYTGQIQSGIPFGIGTWKRLNYVFKGLFINKRIQNGFFSIQYPDGRVHDSKIIDQSSLGEGVVCCGGFLKYNIKILSGNPILGRAQITLDEDVIYNGPIKDGIPNEIGLLHLSNKTYSMSTQKGVVKLTPQVSSYEKIIEIMEKYFKLIVSIGN